MYKKKKKEKEGLTAHLTKRDSPFDKTKKRRLMGSSDRFGNDNQNGIKKWLTEKKKNDFQK